MGRRTDWVMIRVSRATRDKLFRYREALQQCYEYRRMGFFVPPCELGLDAIVDRLLNLVERHRERAKRATKKKRARRVYIRRAQAAMEHSQKEQNGESTFQAVIRVSDARSEEEWTVDL